MRGVRGLGLLLVAWLLGSVAARAEAPVVLFERAPLRPSLCAALRIQLSGSAEVRCLSDGRSPGLADRLNDARVRLRAERASLGVLLERDADPRLVRMYLVSAEGEQAMLAIERIEDRPEPDVDRSLALKVRDAYEVIGFVERELPKQQASAAAVLAKPLPAPSAAPAAMPARAVADRFWQFSPELLGGLAIDGLTRVEYGVQLGFGLVDTRKRLELALGARVYNSHIERGTRGAIRLGEAGPTLAARATFRFARVELGAALQLFLAIASAEGVEGVRGQKQAFTPVVAVGPDLRVRLFRAAYLRFAPALELSTFRQHYTIDDVDLIERKLLGVSLPLSLLFVLPFAQTPEGFQP
jgi:hypothetical protein